MQRSTCYSYSFQSHSFLVLNLVRQYRAYTTREPVYYYHRRYYVIVLRASGVLLATVVYYLRFTTLKYM